MTRHRRPSARARIAALEAVPEFPHTTPGAMTWARWTGKIAEYEGPLRDLGKGIPRRRSRHPLIWRLQRAAWHVALGYASGFPVRDILAFTVRGFWRIVDVTDAGRLPVVHAEVVSIDSEALDLDPSRYAQGGIVHRAFGQPVSKRLVWAEPGDGREQYIGPVYGDAARRARNLEILAEAQRRLEGGQPA